MRDRLIELFKKTDYNIFPDSTVSANLANQFSEYALNDIVDKLLENGVIVPPCKVGDKVYVNPETWGGISFINYIYLFIHSKYFLVGEVVSVIKTRKQNLIKLKVYNRTTCTSEYRRYPVSSIGKIVFLTKEGVIKTLKGGEG